MVVPKQLRDQLGLCPGAVEIVADGRGIRIEALAFRDLAESDGRLVIPKSGTDIDDALVQALRNSR